MLHISFSYAKILGEQIFAHGRFPEVGQKQKMEEKKKKKKKKVGENNGQLRFVDHHASTQARLDQKKKERERD